MKNKKQPSWLPKALKRYHEIYDAFGNFKRKKTKK
jgi:hypothetical protein